MGKRIISPAKAIVLNQDIIYENKTPREKPKPMGGGNDFKAVFDKAMKELEKKGCA